MVPIESYQIKKINYKTNQSTCTVCTIYYDSKYFRVIWKKKSTVQNLNSTICGKCQGTLFW